MIEAGGEGEGRGLASAPTQQPASRGRLAWWFGTPLWLRIIGALLLGALYGALAGEAVVQIKWIGDLFLRLIRMLVIPIIFIMVVSAVSAAGDTRRLGSIGARTILLYLFAMIVSIFLGLGLGTLFRPGAGVSLEGLVPEKVSSAPPFSEQLLAIVPTNPVEALAQGNVVSILFFALLLGIGIILAADKGKPLADIFQSGMDVMLKVVQIVIELAPFGVFSLVAWVVGTKGLGAFAATLNLSLCVLIACLLQLLVLHVGIAALFGRMSPTFFLRGIANPILVGFSSTSSSATLPVAITAAERNLKLPPAIAAIVLPLGVAIGKNGTAMYMALLAVFSAQALGMDLSVQQYLLVAAATLMMSVSTAPIPSGSLFLLTGVLQVIGISDAQTAVIVAFIFPLDRPLDMMRTVPNVTGGLAVAAAVSRLEKRRLTRASGQAGLASAGEAG